MSETIPSIPTPSSESSSSNIAQCTQDAVFMKTSEKIPEDTPVVKGEDFSEGANLDAMVQKMLTTGFQATNVALAIEVINKMVSKYFVLPKLCATIHRIIIASHTRPPISADLVETERRAPSRR